MGYGKCKGVFSAGVTRLGGASGGHGFSVLPAWWPGLLPVAGAILPPLLNKLGIRRVQSCFYYAGEGPSVSPGRPTPLSVRPRVTLP